MHIGKMLRSVSLVVLVVSTSIMARAQNGQMPSADKRAAKMTEWMTSNLNLTADQVPKVQDLNMKYAVQMDSLRNNGQAKEDKFSAMKSVNTARNAELKGILTDDQYKTYLEKKQEMKGRFKEKSKDRNMGAGQ